MSENTCSIEEFIREYSMQIRNKSASLFIGSGLSRAASYIDWKGLLKDVAIDIGLDVEKETDLISLAEYYVNTKRNRVKIDNAISQFFGEIKEPTIAHDLLASLPITNYWTTNYDKLIERTLDKVNLSYSLLTNDDSFRKYINGNNIIIHKLHGDVESPHEAVITKQDYDEFKSKHEILLAKLKGEMCSNSFLFLGYSFSDTDINHILTEIKLFYKGQPAKNHYCIQEYIKRKSDEREDEFEYRKRKQKHHITALQTYGIQTVLVDNFETDIPQVLKRIRKIVYSKNVFISGACEIDDAQLETYSQYARTLSTWLVTKNFKIFSGYGNNIGAAVVSGVHDGCRVSKRHTIKKFNEQLTVTPFPYKNIRDESERKQIYTEIRQNTISKTQIIIIINGTKKEKRKTVNSDGILEEYTIAKELDCLIIPIAATGGAAFEIWENMRNEDSAYTNSEDFLLLKDGQSFSEIYDAVQRIIENHMR